ncbi:endolytic transglycosylase MltG [Venatoribacter cucullus]|nr:endolytic transglycosylase MltG [Venatoribacter cucullus]
MLKRILTGMSLLLVLLCGLLLANWLAPLNNTDTVRVDIRPGQTLSALSRQWQADGWLPSALVLRIQARLLGYERSLRTGEYDIPPGLNGTELLALLATATPVSYRIALIEGQPLREALRLLAAETRLQQDVEPFNEEQVARLLGINGSAEGWIYPDTYVFQRGEKVSVLLQQGYQRMQQQLQQAWEQRQPGLPYKTPYDALIMASLVEKETGVEYERAQIAGVFVRRLQKKMRLETDPTVIYGLGEAFSGNLRRSHLRDAANVWNTYRHRGLPPTPIALAGRKALEAALHPAEGTELFFVARGDGTHVFSDTLEAHNRAVREYQIRNRRTDYRSAPPPASPASAEE